MEAVPRRLNPAVVVNCQSNRLFSELVLESAEYEQTRKLLRQNSFVRLYVVIDYSSTTVRNIVRATRLLNCNYSLTGRTSVISTSNVNLFTANFVNPSVAHC